MEEHLEKFEAFLSCPPRCRHGISPWFTRLRGRKGNCRALRASELLHGNPGQFRKAEVLQDSDTRTFLKNAMKQDRLCATPGPRRSLSHIWIAL